MPTGKAWDGGRDPMPVHQPWRRDRPGAAGIFERGGKAAATAEIAGGTVRDLHARIAKPAVANDPP